MRFLGENVLVWSSDMQFVNKYTLVKKKYYNVFEIYLFHDKYTTNKFLHLHLFI